MHVPCASSHVYGMCADEQPAWAIDVCDGSLCACIAAGLVGTRGAGGGVLSLQNAPSSPPVARHMWARFVERLAEGGGGAGAGGACVGVALADATCDDTEGLRALLLELQQQPPPPRSPPPPEDGRSVAGRLGLVMGEPFYHCVAGRQTLSALNFWHQVAARPACTCTWRVTWHVHVHHVHAHVHVMLLWLWVLSCCACCARGHVRTRARPCSRALLRVHPPGGRAPP